jgi:hypothetical protein
MVTKTKVPKNQSHSSLLIAPAFMAVSLFGAHHPKIHYDNKVHVYMQDGQMALVENFKVSGGLKGSLVQVNDICKIELQMSYAPYRAITDDQMKEILKGVTEKQKKEIFDKAHALVKLCMAMELMPANIGYNDYPAPKPQIRMIMDQRPIENNRLQFLRRPRDSLI